MDTAGSYVQQRPAEETETTIAHERLMERARGAVPKTPVEYDTADSDQRETAVDLDDIYMNEPFES